MNTTNTTMPNHDGDDYLEDLFDQEGAFGEADCAGL